MNPTTNPSNTTLGFDDVQAINNLCIHDDNLDTLDPNVDFGIGDLGMDDMGQHTPISTAMVDLGMDIDDLRPQPRERPSLDNIIKNNGKMIAALKEHLMTKTIDLYMLQGKPN